MRFIAIKQVYQPLFAKLLQAFNLLQLILISLWLCISFEAEPYPLIRLPLDASHSVLAVCRRWRLCFTASKTDTSSSSLNGHHQPGHQTQRPAKQIMRQDVKKREIPFKFHQRTANGFNRPLLPEMRI